MSKIDRILQPDLPAPGESLPELAPADRLAEQVDAIKDEFDRRREIWEQLEDESDAETKE